MTVVNHWKLFCNTENSWVYGFLEKSQGEPTTCFNNTNHTINNESFYLIETIGDIQEVYVKAEKIPTASSSFRNEGGVIDILPNEEKVIPYVWNKNINILNISCTPNADNIGDEINLIVSPNTTIGVLSEDSEIGDTILHVATNTVLQYLKIGYEVLLNGVVVGEAIEIDLNAKTILLSDALTAQYLTGAYLGFQVRMIKNLNIASIYPINVGRLAVGPSFLPANTLSHVIYKNKSSNQKQFFYNLEYLY